MRSQGIARRAVLLSMPAALAGPQVLASGYPSRRVSLVVAAPPGGAPDTLARMLAKELASQFGQPVVVENKPGATGMIASAHVARSPADGHTLLLSWLGDVTSQALIAKRTVDIHRDFVHVTQLTSTSNVLIARPSTGFGTFADLLSFARSHPAQLTYASSGNGTSGHLAMELLKLRAHVSMIHVPYQGGVAALNGLLAGEVDIMFINQDALLPHAEAQRFRMLGVTSLRRNPLLPNLPTIAESGFPGFEATTWAGLSVPRGTPEPVVAAIQAAAVKVIHGPLSARLKALGTQVVASSAEEYTAFMRRQHAEWSHVIKHAGIRSD